MSQWKHRIEMAVLLIFVMVSVAAQVRGVVTDSVSRERLPYVSISYNNKGVGHTDNNGDFYVRIPDGCQTLTFSSVGYKSKTVTLEPVDGKKTLNVQLIPDNVMLKEMVVRPRRERYRKKDNPAIVMMRKVLAAKQRNRLEDNDYYRYHKYEKLNIALDDINPTSLNKGVLKKMPFLLDQLEVNAEDNALVLPVSVKETSSEVLYRKHPQRKKTFVEGIRSSGLDDLFHMGDVTDGVLQDVFADVDIYENNIYLLKKKFVSPISDRAISFYKYYIMDTIYVERDKCFHLTFVPYNSQDFGFTGHLYVLADSSYTVRRCIMNLPQHTGVNFVEELSLKQDFQQMPNGYWGLAVDDMSTKIYPFKNWQGAVVRRVTRYSDFSFAPIPEDDFGNARLVETQPDAYLKDKAFWQDARSLPLTQKEAEMDKFVKNVQKTPGAKYVIWLLRLFAENYVETGSEDRPSKFDVGPLSTVVSSNYVDGLRLRLGGSTTANLNPHFFFKGYYAYGFKDKRSKYMGELEYSFEKKAYMPFEFPRHSVAVSYQSDVMSPLDKFLTMDKDNMFGSIKTTTVDQMMYFRKLTLRYEYESFSGFSTKLELRHNEEEPTGKLQYIRNDGAATPTFVHRLTTAEAALTLRYAPHETYINTKQSRHTVNRNAPVFTLGHTVGLKGVMGGDYSYHLTEASFFKRLWLASWGKMDVTLKAGAQWSKVPFPLLLMPPSNPSYFLQRGSFNMLTNMEFLNDRYASIDIDYDMNGKLLNRIPFLRRLKWREHFGVKAFYGALTDKNNPYLRQDADLYLFPTRDGETSSFIMERGKPYVELMVGVHNIFRILQVDYVRRVNYLDHPGVNKHGVRLSLKLTF